jgi:cysteine desulfurase
MIYFDNNATTMVAPEALDALTQYLVEHFGNPSSSHAAGRRAKKAVAQSRVQVAEFLGAGSPDEIVFTASGSEADNWAILGALKMMPDKRHIVTTRVEHEAVRKLCERLEVDGYRVTWLEVDADGSLDLEQLKASLTADTVVVSIMHANNETGILFPVAEIGGIVKERSNALFHVDGVNAAGKVPIDLKSTKIDLYAISGHKFHAPKGVGALYIRDDVLLPSSIIGGGQEGGRRAGTEAVHQIAALGAAACLAMDPAGMARARALRDRIEYEILKKIPNSRLNGTSDADRRLPNTSNISFENTNGEMIMARLDEIGVCVSTGSACNSGGHTASPVLQAMNVPYSWAMGSIRFSLGRYNTEIELDHMLAALPGIVSELRELSDQH